MEITVSKVPEGNAFARPTTQQIVRSAGALPRPGYGMARYCAEESG